MAGKKKWQAGMKGGSGIVTYLMRTRLVPLGLKVDLGLTLVTWLLLVAFLKLMPCLLCCLCTHLSVSLLTNNMRVCFLFGAEILRSFLWLLFKQTQVRQFVAALVSHTREVRQTKEVRLWSFCFSELLLLVLIDCSSFCAGLWPFWFCVALCADCFGW